MTKSSRYLWWLPHQRLDDYHIANIMDQDSPFFYTPDDGLIRYAHAIHHAGYYFLKVSVHLLSITLNPD